MAPLFLAMGYGCAVCAGNVAHFLFRPCCKESALWVLRSLTYLLRCSWETLHVVLQCFDVFSDLQL